MIAAIVAVDENWGIGFNGDLLEKIPADLKRFKELTTGNVVVMGRKTWDSLPIKPLPNRMNYIISRDYPCIKDEKTIQMQMDMIIYTIQINLHNDNWFIIGGGQIYKELLPLCDRVYLTKIHKTHENVDTYFPDLDEMDDWVLSSQSEIMDYNGIPYQFMEYDRIN